MIICYFINFKTVTFLPFYINIYFFPDYVAINYSDCFNLPPRPCPKIVPCPSKPTCPDHRYHRMGQKYVFVTSRRRGTVIPPRRTFPRLPSRTTTPSLPAHMLRGKRRYMAFLRKKVLEELKVTANMKNQNKKKTKTLRTVVVKKELFVKNGRSYVKNFVKGVVTTLKKPKKAKRPLTGKDSVDYLE